MSNSKAEALKAVLAQGKPQPKFPKAKDQKFTKDELMKKYFVPRVPNGQTTAKFNVRIVPNAEGEDPSPFKEVKFHNIKIGPDWNKLLCLSEVGLDCPLCDTMTGLYAANDKDGAKAYRAHKFYIVRVIDRAVEQDGIKFWRFKENYKKNGEFDKILAKLENDYDVLDASAEGYDLVITCSLDDRGNSIITDISCPKNASALAATEEKVAELINDTTTWKDIYKPKTVEYLESVVNGTAQYWDKVLKKYVTPGKVEEPVEKVEGVKDDGAQTNPLLKDEKITEDNILDDADDTDLPF